MLSHDKSGIFATKIGTMVYCTYYMHVVCVCTAHEYYCRMCVTRYVGRYIGVGAGQAGQVLAGPLFSR